MSLVRQSLRTRPPFGELGDPPLPNDGQVLFEEEFHRVVHAPHVRKPKKQEETAARKDTQRVLRTSSKKELTYADHVERLMIGKITFLLHFFFFLPKDTLKTRSLLIE
jgi:hypothetical protein